MLILDEAVSALDKSVEAQVLNLLGDLKQQFNLTYIFISHDLHVVRYIADRVMVMYLGQVVELGPADGDLRSAHASLYPGAAGLPADGWTRRTASTPRRSPATRQSPINPPSGCRFRTRCASAEDVCEAKMPTLGDGLNVTADRHLAACHMVHPVPATAARPLAAEAA